LFPLAAQVLFYFLLAFYLIPFTPCWFSEPTAIRALMEPVDRGRGTAGTAVIDPSTPTAATGLHENRANTKKGLREVVWARSGDEGLTKLCRA
jgi:hypothetical protein